MIPAPLVYALIGAAFLAAAHRTVRALSWRAALALLLLPLAFTGKALLTGRVFGPLDIAYQAAPLKALAPDFGIRPHNAALSDTHCQLTPWGKSVRWAWSQGEWPLWNPFMFCGDILAASSSPGPYDPSNLATLLSPLPDRLGLAAALSILLAGLAMFLFLRELDCAEPSALLGAVGWMFCDFRIFWIGLPQTPTVACLPLLLLAVRRLCARPRVGNMLLLTLALVLVVLPGHPESTAHVVLVGVLYGLWQLRAGGRADPAMRRRWLRPVAVAAAAGALALLLSAVHLLPLLDALEQSNEHRQRSQVYAALDRSATWSEVAAGIGFSFAPLAFGRPGWGLGPNAPARLDPAGGYAGSVLLPLAIFGLARARSRERWVLLGLGLLGLLASASAPGVADLLAKVPPFDIAINERFGFAWSFAVAALAALGAQAWSEAPDRRRLAGIVLATLVGLALLVLAFAPATLEGRLDPEPFRRLVGWLLLPLLLLWALARGWRPAAGAVVVMAALLVAQRVGEMGDVYGVFPRAAFFPRPPVLEKLPAIGAGGEQPYRVVGLGYTLIPNGAAMWELEDPRGYQAITHRRFAALLSMWSTPQPVWFNLVADLRAPLLSFLNVRYAIADSTATAVAGWRRRYHGGDASLFENQNALPRAFVPERVRMGGAETTVLSEIRAERDFRRRAWIELPGEPGTGAPQGRANGAGEVRTWRQGSGYLLDADMRSAGWVVMSVTHWRGWRAALEDGSELPLAFGNHAFLALRLPAGQHRVRLWYRPSSFVWGRALSLATAAALGALALAHAWRRRRQPRPVSMASP